MQIFVDKNITIEINEYSSVYSLKKEIYLKNGVLPEKQSLFYHGKPLEDHQSLKEIKNGDTVNMSQRMLGGGGTSFFLILFMLVTMLILSLLMLTGTLPLVAHIYYAIVNWGYSMLKNLSQEKEWLKGNIVVKIILLFGKFLLFVLRFAILYIFFYVLVMAVTIVTYMAKSHNFCDSYKYASKTGNIVAIVFCVIYLMYNFVDIGADITGKIGERMPIFGPTFGIITGNVKTAWDRVKFLPIYSIPIIGQIVKIVFMLIDDGLEALDKGERETQKVVNEIVKIEQYGGDLMGFFRDDMFLNWFANALNMKELIRYVNLSLQPKMPPETSISDRLTARFTKIVFFNGLAMVKGFFWIMSKTCEMDMSDLEKTKQKLIANRNAGKNVNAQIKQINNMLEKQISPIDAPCMGNMIKTGAVSGILSWIAFVITWIIFMIRV